MIPFEVLQKEVDRFKSHIKSLQDKPDKDFDLQDGRYYRMGIDIWSQFDQLSDRMRSFSDKVEAPREQKSKH